MYCSEHQAMRYFMVLWRALWCRRQYFYPSCMVDRSSSLKGPLSPLRWTLVICASELASRIRLLASIT